MKRTILALTVALTALSGAAATAQPYRDHDRDGVPNRYDNHDSRADRHDNRHDNGGHRRWARGERFSGPYHSRTYVVSDWRSRHWRAPPRGYAYYRTDSGDVVLAAIAGGLIASVIANSAH